MLITTKLSLKNIFYLPEREWMNGYHERVSLRLHVIKKCTFMNREENKTSLTNV